MIYFKNEKVKFPRHFNENPTEMVITNELTGEKTVIEVTDASTNGHYYEIDLTDVTLSNGTYRYDMGSEVGLMQVGNYQKTNTQYNEKKVNKVYER